MAQLATDVINSLQSIASAYSSGRTWIKTQQTPVFADCTTIYSGHLVESTNASNVAMNVAGSAGSPKIFQYVVPAGNYFALLGQNIIIVDSAITPIKFGGIAALSNGCYWRVVDASDNIKLNFHTGASITANFEFFHVSAGNIAVGSGSDYFSVQLRARDLGLAPVLEPGWKLQIVIRDDLTSLDRFESSVIGQLLGSDTDIDY